ncbi:MAG TPA: hypothetical protein P5513_06070 [Candidatus Diapherotrites archaeon]|nr:hypothetical protein [Candidatus Diapherotrites archaeon]
MELKNKGKIISQIIEASRKNISELDGVKYGEVTFFIKGGNVYRMEIKMSRLFPSEDNINISYKNELNSQKE